MTLKDRYHQNVKKPQSDLLGRMQLKDMNKRHNPLALWGMEHIDWSIPRSILDIGCGGGRNIANLLQRVPQATVWGVDYSEASVRMSNRLNAEAVAKGRTQVQQGAVEQLPYPDATFDCITAFETIYFWQLNEGLAQTYRVLKPGGQLLIVNEAQNGEGMEETMRKIGFCVYTAAEQEAALRMAGFGNIQVDAHENGQWLAVWANKPAT